jgi:hypothetical protein
MTEKEAIDLARELCIATHVRWSNRVRALFVAADDPLNAPGIPDQWLIFVTDEDLTPMEPDYVLIVVNAPTGKAALEPVF